MAPRRPHGQHRPVKGYRGRYYRSFSRACQARASFRLGRKRAQGSCPGSILGGSDVLRWATETWDVSWAGAADPIGLNLSNAPPLNPGHRQVDAGEDRAAPSLIGAVALCGSLGARDFGPDREGLRPDGSVLGAREVI